MFPERLKQLRSDKGLSQQRLADLLNKAQSSINQYEHSQSEPDIDTLIQLSKVFDTSVDYLVGNTSCNVSIDKLLTYKVTPEEVDLIDKWRKTAPETREAIGHLLNTINNK